LFHYLLLNNLIYEFEQVTYQNKQYKMAKAHKKLLLALKTWYSQYFIKKKEIFYKTTLVPTSLFKQFLHIFVI